jgi:2-iminobutanoate/2-iminopropanoate deaminase
METVSIPHAPAPGGHYSPGIAHGGFVFVSGQLPVNPLTGAVVGEGDIEAQTEQALRNVEAVLLAGGSSLDQVLSMTVYITGRKYWEQVNAVYARILGAHRPARAVIPVPEIKPGCMIEIQAIAARDPR